MSNLGYEGLAVDREVAATQLVVEIPVGMA